MAFALLRPHVLTLRNRLFPPDRSRQHLHRDLLLVFVALLVMGCIFICLSFLMKKMGADPLFRALIPTKIIELLSYSFFILLIFSNTIAVVGTMFASESITLPLTAPVPSFRLYFAKTVEILFETTFMLIIFTLPTALAYQVHLNPEPGFFLTGFLLLIPFSLIPVGLGVVIATVVVRLIALVWRRGTLLLLCIAGAATWVIAELLTFLSAIKVERGGTKALVQMIGLFDNPNPGWLPSRWIADILSSFLGRPAENAQLEVTLLIVSAIGSLALGYLFFDIWLLGSRSAVAALGRRRRGRITGDARDALRGIFEVVYRMFPFEQQTRALILKDLSSLVRDQAQALQLLLYVGIASIYVVVLKLLGGAMNFAPVALKAWTATLASMNVLVAGFVITAMMTRLVYPAVSLEGPAFWILQTTPIGLQKMIRAKFWCWFPIVTFLSVALLLAGAFAIQLPLGGLISTAIIGVCFSFGCTGLAVGIGSIFASFDWESPSQISASLGTLMLLLVGISFVLILSVPAAVITSFLIIPELQHRVGPGLTMALCTLSLTFIIFSNIAISSWSCQLGARSLLARQSR